MVAMACGCDGMCVQVWVASSQWSVLEANSQRRCIETLRFTRSAGKGIACEESVKDERAM
jgi:hypothetical protein